MLPCVREEPPVLLGRTDEAQLPCADNKRCCKTVCLCMHGGLLRCMPHSVALVCAGVLQAADGRGWDVLPQDRCTQLVCCMLVGHVPLHMSPGYKSNVVTSVSLLGRKSGVYSRCPRS